MSRKRDLMYITAGTVLTGIGLTRLARQRKKDKEANGIRSNAKTDQSTTVP
ncbi:hypothetical protein ACEQPO_24815 [Bacillus sp. SL00103]